MPRPPIREICINCIKSLATLWVLVIIVFLLSPIIMALEDKFQGLPLGEGRELVLEYCTDCHSTRVLLQSRLTRDDWDESITDMEVEMREDKESEEEAEEELQELMEELLEEESLGTEEAEVLRLMVEVEEERRTEIGPEERAQILDYLSEALGPKPVEGPLYRPMPLFID